MGGYQQLPITPYRPTDPTETVERAVALRNLLQNAPIQHQILQQQAQAGALENQQRQQQITDQQASTKAWQNWDGKNPDDLIHGILSNGGSGAAANQLAQQLMARQQQHLQLSEAEFTLQQKKTDRMLGRLTAAESVPDDQLAAHAQSAINDSVRAGDLGRL
jgi:hypothetical protein